MIEKLVPSPKKWEMWGKNAENTLVSLKKRYISYLKTAAQTKLINPLFC